MPTIKPIKPFQKSQLQPPNNQFPLKPPVQKSSELSSQEEVDKIFSSGPYSVHLPASNDELKKKNQLFKQPPQPPQQGRGPKKRWIQKDAQEEEQKDMEVDNKEEEEEEEQEQESDISDTEIQLAKLLNTFAKGKKKQDTLSASEMEEIDQAVPYGTEVRMRRMAQENIRIISSRMVRYLLCHEFQGKIIFSCMIKYNRLVTNSFFCIIVRGSRGNVSP